MARQTSSRPRPSRAQVLPVARTYRWLLFVHQLPSSPSNLRVRTWRRLQQIGALPVKQALYVLPHTATAREDFEWLKTEIESAGGQASVYAADGVDAWSNDALVEEFRRSRETSYRALAREAERLLKSASRGRSRTVPGRAVQQMQERFLAIERVDFFGSAGRDRVVTLVHQLEAGTLRAASESTGRHRGTSVAEYRGRQWVTRPRPGVDRMACAWLIRRFIDPKAQFGFVADRDAAPQDAVPFDMVGVEFTHRGDACTFETLCDVFQLEDPALPRIGAVVHDLDLKDGRFGAPEGPTLDILIEGLRLTHDDDTPLLESGIALFESLYRGTAHALKLQGPRPVSRRRVSQGRQMRRASRKRR